MLTSVVDIIIGFTPRLALPTRKKVSGIHHIKDAVSPGFRVGAVANTKSVPLSGIESWSLSQSSHHNVSASPAPAPAPPYRYKKPVFTK
jgi:hypothetical protein